ncbi:MAG: diacylglycerol kinase family protein [Deltaproteobacteria bacterium]|nr:diacylglycerol kinase family protein [Deltaproteobacteria bacterium]
MTTWAIICNPTSGRFHRDTLALIESACHAQGITPRILLTEAPGHATVLARQVKGVDRVMVYGGDGTLNEAANGLAGGGVPLGFLPGGTANSTAREIGLPLDPVKAVGVMAQAKVLPVRLGRINYRYFINMAGLGFDATTIFFLTKEAKGALGPLAYILFGFRTLLYSHPSMEVITPDGKRRPAIWVVAARAKTYAGWMTIHPRAGMFQPRLGLMAVNGWMLVPFGIGRLLLRLPIRGPGLVLDDHATFQVTVEKPVHAHVDGCYLGLGQRFDFGLADKELLFCFPS